MFRMLLWIAAAGCFGKLVYDALNQPSPYEADETRQPDAADEASAVGDTCRAVVTGAYREMDPITLQARTVVTFCLPDESTWQAGVSGEGGQYLQPGDEGLLERSGDVFLSFVKDSGEVIGAMYYIPASAAEEE